MANSYYNKPEECDECGGEFYECSGVLTCTHCGDELVLCDMCEADCDYLLPPSPCNGFMRESYP